MDQHKAKKFRAKGQTHMRIAKFLQWHWNTYGYSPSYRDIGLAVGLKSVSSVSLHLDRMEADKWIVKDDFQRRSIRLIPGAIPEICKHDWRVDPFNSSESNLRVWCLWCGRKTEVENPVEDEAPGTWLRFMGNP